MSRRIDIPGITPGFASNPITVNDHVAEYNASMVAGLIGIQATSSGPLPDDKADHNDGGSHPPATEAENDSIRPL